MCVCVLRLQLKLAAGKAWLDWEQVAFKCKPIPLAVEEAWGRLQVMEDVLKEGNLWLLGNCSSVSHSCFVELSTFLSIFPHTDLLAFCWGRTRDVLIVQFWLSAPYVCPAS